MKKLLVLAALMSATAANAKTTTEYYVQPGAGGSALTLDYTMKNDPIKDAADADAKTSSADLGINYAYGLNDTMAVGAKTFFGSYKTDAKTASGMGDIHAYFAGFSDMIHYGVDLGLNMGKQKWDAEGQTNRSSGGMSLTGNVGVLTSASGWNFGGDLSYSMPQERTADNNGTDAKATGGNVMKLAAFGEYNYGMGFFVAELSTVNTGEITVKSGSTESKTKSDSYTGISLKGTYDVNDMATAFASLGFRNFGSNDNHKAYMGTDIALGVRLGF